MASPLSRRLSQLERSLGRNMESIVCIPMAKDMPISFLEEIVPGVFSYKSIRENAHCRSIIYNDIKMLNEWLDLPAQSQCTHCVYKVLSLVECEKIKNYLEQTV